MAELYGRYRHLVFGVAYKYLKNREEAEDMVSYVFNLILEKLPGKEVRSFKQYLYGMVRNECLAKHRRIKKEQEKQQEWAILEKNNPQFMENESYMHLINEKSLEDVIQQAMQELGDEQRVCVFHFFFEGKSYKEIADITGYEIKKVKSYLQNGKRNLKKKLESQIQDLPS
ncbi:MAG: sigma-70 family RNA polymerase sigma factor [Phaeodactylibacter sp.]|nr:sigma-70 family RNA polymerase sigma factor [Phaeodactylibacter sp.]